MAMNLGSLEESILLLVAKKVNREAYGFSITEEYREHFKQGISISAVHTVLKRLEQKGFISSKMGGATAERGGRSKRIFEVTNMGMSTLEQIQESRVKLWEMIPKLS